MKRKIAFFPKNALAERDGLPEFGKKTEKDVSL